MGTEAEHIYKSMTFATSRINPEDANDYDTVLRKFEAYFIPTDPPVRQPVPPAGAAADPYVTRSGRTVVRPARFREN